MKYLYITLTAVLLSVLWISYAVMYPTVEHPWIGLSLLVAATGISPIVVSYMLADD